MFWTDPKYEISIQILPKIDMEGKDITKGKIVHKNSRYLVGVDIFSNLLYEKLSSV